MSNTFSRRNFLYLTASAGAAATLRPAPATAGVSYLKPIISPNNERVVFDWTDLMLQSIRDTAVPPPPAARALAMGHLAGFLAMNAVEQRYADQFGIGAAPAGANPQAAFSAAAATAFTGAMDQPISLMDGRINRRIPSGEGKTLGIRFGREVGRKIARWRALDGASETKANFYRGGYRPNKSALGWEPMLSYYRSGIGPRVDAYTYPLLPSWGLVTPFTSKDITAFRSRPFYEANDPAFVEDYKMVFELGRSDSKLRTEDESEIAFFWEDGARGATPPGHFLILAAQLFQGRFDDVTLARHMALCAMVMADAGINAWDNKFHYGSVRPETLYRGRARRVSNPDIQGLIDKKWMSLIPTPPFPSYTSGHSTFGAAGARMIQHCLGTDEAKYTLEPVDLAWWPNQLKGAKRHYTSVWKSAEENGLSRLYGGVHWELDHIEGMRAGVAIADHAAEGLFAAV